MLSTKRRPLEIRAGSAVRQIIRRIKQDGRCFGLRPAPPVEHFKFCPGLKCFSDTSVDILFDFVNALKMPPPRFCRLRLIRLHTNHETGKKRMIESFDAILHFLAPHLTDVIYEVHPCKDHRSVDLISEAALWSALLLRSKCCQQRNRICAPLEPIRGCCDSRLRCGWQRD